MSQQLQPQTQQEQPQQSSSQQMTLQQLKDYIHLSSNKLLQLTYSQQKFITTITKFINSSIQHIQQQQHQQALVYLAQAERVLQYGASCGKSIDRNLIICVLNNQACSYYREGQLAKCASYLEGVIYNLKAFGISMDSTPTQSSLLSQNNKNRTHDQFYHVSVQKKVQLVYYHLKYCTINSQINKTQVALKTGKSVVNLVKSIYDDLLFQNPKIHTSQTTKPSISSSQSSLSAQDQLKQFKDIIKIQIFFKEQIDCQNLQIYRKLTRVYVKKWNQKKLSSRINKTFQRYIQNYSLSQVIEIIPTQYSSNTDKIYVQLVNTKVLLRQLLHLAMGYFTISTQYRLMAEKRYPKQMEEKQVSEEWKLANIYHLMSILFLGINLNCDLLFMKQLITSYQQHYKFQLLVDQHFPDEQLQSQCQSILFEARKSKFSKQNQLLFEKISKIKEKQSMKTSSKSKDLNRNGDYKTLNNTKLNISKQINTPHKRKRSISKKEQSSLTSSKRISQKTSMNTSMMNKTKVLNNQNQNQQKHTTRKRSYSKDSIKQTKKTIGHLGVEKLNNAQQRTVNQYQLVTPNKKLTQEKIRKRRISSVSSGKDIITNAINRQNRQNSKKSKTKGFQFNNSNNQKDKRDNLDSVKSPPKTEKFKSPTIRTQRGTQKQKNPSQRQKLSVKPKKKVQKIDKGQKQTKKKKVVEKNYYF